MTGALLNASESDWRHFATSIAESALQGYKDGEMDLEKLLAVVHKCARSCDAGYRRLLVGLTYERALTITPKFLNHGRPDFPAWFRRAIVDLVELHIERAQANDQEAIDNAKAWLADLALYADLSDATLRRWLQERRRRELRPRRRGRPPKKNAALST